MSAIPYLLIYLVPVLVVGGYYLGGVFNLLTPFFVFGVIPVVDWIAGANKWNPSAEEEAKLTESKAFRVLVMLTTPVFLGLVVWGAWMVGRGGLGVFEFVAFTVSVGIAGGVVGITPAHEMVHRIDGRFERILAHLSLMGVYYMHWGDEHVKGHHRNVATPLDPTTARFGESFYAYYPRTVLGTIGHAWKIEEERLGRRGLGPYVWRNRMIPYMLLPLLFGLALAAVFGSPWVLVFFLGQSCVAFTLLEITNYLEHYGMERQEVAEGRYERVSPLHSWNASNWVTNYFLFNLQRHSDHHAKPRRRYQILRHYDEAPQLPTGYAGMILLALVPPLWFKVMDPRVEEHRARIAAAGGAVEGAAAG